MNNSVAPAPPAASNQSERVSEEVMQVMELRTQPFNDDPGDGDWFVDDTTRDQLQVIRTALVTGDDLLLISGEPGSGKTVLLKQFISSSGARLQCMSVSGSEHFVTRDLFAGLLKVFKLNAPVDMGDMLNEVVPCLQAWTERNTLGVIVLDDADSVPDSEITELLSAMKYLNGGDEVLLRILLAAKPDFEPKIPTLLPPGSDLPYSALAMEPLDLPRSSSYLDFRLNQAGNFDENQFSDRELQSIFTTSRGLPARLNQAAAAELNIKYDSSHLLAEDSLSEPVLQKGPVKLLLGLLGVGLILAGLYLFLPRGASQEDNYTVVARKPIVTTENSAKIKLLNEDENPSVNDSNTSLEAASNPEAATAAQPDTTAVATSSAQQTAEQLTDTNTTAGNAELSIPATDTVSPPLTASTDAGTQTPIEAPTPDTVSTDASASIDAATTPESTSSALAPTGPVAATTPEASSATTNPPTNAESPAPATQTGKVGDIESANWVLVQKPDQFTVQLSSSTDLDSVKSFLKRSNLEPPNSIFSYKQGNNTRYALVHGLFTSISDASAAIEKMNAAARRDQPWIRSIKQIQNSLKK